MTDDWRRLLRIWRRTPARDVDAELAFHFDERIAELCARGADPDAARAQVGREFGDRARVRRDLVSIDQRIDRQMRVIERLASWRDDLRYVLRSLRRSPGFVVTVILTLALGLGANAAVFSFLDQLFLRPPAGVEHPSDVRRIYRHESHTRAAAFASPLHESQIVPMFDYPEVRALRAALPASAELATYSTGTAKLGRGRDAPEISEAYIDGPYFTLLGVHPLAGRFFAASELRPEIPTAVAVVSERLWKSRFGGRADLVGQVAEIDNHQFVIIGITGNGFLGADREPVDIWVPMNTTGGFAPASPRWYDVLFSFRIAALVHAPASSTAHAITARADLAFRTGPLADDSISTALLGPLVEAVQPGSDASSVAIATRLAGVALIILLIAIANVINLLLARAVTRRREIAVRVALGVSRTRLLRLLVCESAVLGVAAAAVALASAWWTGDVLRRSLLPGTHWADSPLDARVVGFVAALMVLVTGIIAVIPAVQSTRAGLIDSLKLGAQAGSYRRSVTRTALLIGQAALSVVLLVAAGVFVRSLHSVETEDLGFDAHQLVSASVRWDDGDYAAALQSGFSALLERIRHLPGVVQAATTSLPPMAGVRFAAVLRQNGDSVRQLKASTASPNWVSPEYFAATGMPVLRGRGIRADDRTGSAPVMVVNQTMAHMVWPGESPIGQCLIVVQRSTACLQVVGVVGDAHMMRIIEPPLAQFYVPAAQDTGMPSVDLVIRAAPGRAVAVAAAVRSAIRASYGDWAIPRVHTLDETLAPQLRPWRLGAALFSAAGLLALLVAMVGIYSTISYTFSQRTHEIGVRMALGARAATVVRLVVGDGLRVVVIGIVIGLALSWAAGRLVASMLYKTSPHDPVVLIGVTAALVLVAVAACLVPAWRASRVDPVIALRAE